MLKRLSPGAGDRHRACRREDHRQDHRGARKGGAPIGGLKVVTENGWFAARPSGTEDVYKIYAESFLGRDHLVRLQEEARAMVGAAFKAAGV